MINEMNTGVVVRRKELWSTLCKIMVALHTWGKWIVHNTRTLTVTVLQIQGDQNVSVHLMITKGKQVHRDFLVILYKLRHTKRRNKEVLGSDIQPQTVSHDLSFF